jgi:thiopeptide-type bacteriocin biosynthesis protein
LSLNISEPADRYLLRKQLETNPESQLFEDVTHTLGGADWLDGREHELTVPLYAKPGWQRPARPRIRVATLRGRADTTKSRPEVHFPGDAWAYFRLYVSAGSTDVFLVDSLRELIHGVLGGHSHWFYIRYSVPSDHIRLRVQTDAATTGRDLLGEVARWGRRQWENGSLREFDVATYVPETWRYGSGPAMRSAEAVFWRDSQATLAQLNGRISRRLGISAQELAAINYLHLLESFGLPDWREQLRDHIGRDRPEGVTPEQRRRLQDLVGVGNSWAGLSTDAAGRDLLASWQERAGAAAAYGRQLSLQSAGDTNAVITAVMSVLHMHFNRLCGIDEPKERQSLSLLRELVVSQLSRKEA